MRFRAVIVTGLLAILQATLRLVHSDNNNNGDVEERDENILEMWPMSHLGDFKVSWTEDVYCPPGSYITGYKLIHSESGQYLRHMAAACSGLDYGQLSSDTSTTAIPQLLRPHKVLNVGVTNLTLTEQDLKSFVSSGPYYHAAVGASWSSYPRKVRTGGIEEWTTAKLELLFQDWSSPTTVIHTPISYEIEDYITYGTCTKNFALCGIKAEIHRAEYFVGIEAFIRQLSFFCCYMCSPQEIHLDVRTFFESENGGDGDGKASSSPVMLPVPIGLEVATAEEKDEFFHDIYMENVPNSKIRSVYQEIGREFKPTWFTNSIGAPPPGTDPLLKYKYSQPISLEFFHSSFGSHLYFQPGIIAASTSQQKVYSSSLLPTFMSTNNYSCFKSNQSSSSSKKNFVSDAERTSSMQWKSSPVLRRIWQDGMNLLMTWQKQKRQYPSPWAHLFTEPELWHEELEMKMGNFTCHGGTSCSVYQRVAQCGVMRIYLPHFCNFSSKKASFQGKLSQEG